MDEILIDIGIGAILRTLKNPAKKAALRKAMLKVFNAIKVAYAGDAEFS